MGAPKATDTPTAAAADNTYVQEKQTSELSSVVLQHS